MVFLVVLLFCTLVSSREWRLSTPERSLGMLFPGAQVVVRNIVISDEQKRAIERLARSKLHSRLLSVYIVKKGGKVLAYGYVDVHRVRTRMEAVLFVISPKGEILAVEILAFNEPLEYMADERWLELLKGKSIERDQLRIGRDVPNITGATLTARAIVKASRRALAIWKVLFGGEG